jgi:hypothetical protein
MRPLSFRPVYCRIGLYLEQWCIFFSLNQPRYMTDFEGSPSGGRVRSNGGLIYPILHRANQVDYLIPLPIYSGTHGPVGQLIQWVLLFKRPSS